MMLHMLNCFSHFLPTSFRLGGGYESPFLAILALLAGFGPCLASSATLCPHRSVVDSLAPFGTF